MRKSSGRTQSRYAASLQAWEPHWDPNTACGHLTGQALAELRKQIETQLLADPKDKEFRSAKKAAKKVCICVGDCDWARRVGYTVCMYLVLGNDPASPSQAPDSSAPRISNHRHAGIGPQRRGADPAHSLWPSECLFVASMAGMCGSLSQLWRAVLF